MKLTNTWKHAAVGSAIGFVSGTLQKLINYLPNTIFEIGWFTAIAFFAASLLWEYWQYQQHGAKRFYWSIRGLDTVCDIFAGNAGCILLLWYGGIL